MCTSGFLLVSHIGLVCPGAKVHGGSVRNSNGLWDETKVNARHCLEARALPTLILTLTLTPILTRTRTLARRVASLGLLAYDCWRSQSRMRIATTASPVSGSEVPSLTRTLALSPNPSPTPHPPYRCASGRCN